MYQVAVTPRAFSSLILELSCYKKTETGGVFLGTTNGKYWNIIETIFSGPNATHKSAEFLYDYDYVHYQANMLSKLYCKQLQVIGLWHSHTKMSPFSLADDETNNKFAKLTPYGTLSFLVNLEVNQYDMYHISYNGKQTKVSYSIKKIKYPEINIHSFKEIRK